MMLLKMVQFKAKLFPIKNDNKFIQLNITDDPESL